MSNTFPASLLSLANVLIPPVDYSLSVSALLSFSVTSNAYVSYLVERFFDYHCHILSTIPFEGHSLQSIDELKLCLIEYGYTSEAISRFLADFAELLLVGSFSSPEILAKLKLLPSHLY